MGLLGKLVRFAALTAIANATLQIVPGGTWTAVRLISYFSLSILMTSPDKHRQAYTGSRWRYSESWRDILLVMHTQSLPTIINHSQGWRRQDRRLCLPKHQLLLVKQPCRMEVRRSSSNSARVRRSRAQPCH